MSVAANHNSHSTNGETRPSRPSTLEKRQRCIGEAIGAIGIISITTQVMQVWAAVSLSVSGESQKCI